MNPPSPPFPPLLTHFPCDWLTGRSLQAFIAAHSTAPIGAPSTLSCTVKPGMHWTLPVPNLLQLIICIARVF